MLVTAGVVGTVSTVGLGCVDTDGAMLEVEDEVYASSVAMITLAVLGNAFCTLAQTLYAVIRLVEVASSIQLEATHCTEASPMENLDADFVVHSKVRSDVPSQEAVRKLS